MIQFPHGCISANCKQTETQQLSSMIHQYEAIQVIKQQQWNVLNCSLWNTRSPEFLYLNMFWLHLQVMMKADSTQCKQTHSDLVEPQLWDMRTVKFLLVTGCGLDMRVQGHFLKCAPPTSPCPRLHLISSIPKQKLLLWEKCSATYACAEPQTAGKQDSQAAGVSVNKVENTSA